MAGDKKIENHCYKRNYNVVMGLFSTVLCGIIGEGVKMPQCLVKHHTKDTYEE
jgi:hypothetical protein